MFLNTIINLIYDTVYLNCSKLLQNLIKFIKCFRIFEIFFEIFLKNKKIFKQTSNLNNFLKHNYISYLCNVLNFQNFLLKLKILFKCY